MKQPLLGRKIQEWRKAKGLTQEELVEQCNINVRTIQRIEAGEVTPRYYTIKAILEVLGVEPEELKESQLEGGEEKLPAKLNSFLKFSIIGGIVYLLLAVLESVIDFKLIVEKSTFSLGFGLGYTFLKIGVVGMYLIFMLGFVKLGQSLQNMLLKITAILMVAFTLIILFEDVLTYWMGVDIFSGLVFRSIAFGVLLILFAASLIFLNKQRGNIYLIAGVLGFITGISFLTVILALPGLILLTIFEIVLILTLYQEFRNTLEYSILDSLSKTQTIW